MGTDVARGFSEGQHHCILLFVVYFLDLSVCCGCLFVCLLRLTDCRTDRGFVEGQDHCIGQRGGLRLERAA